MASIQIREEIKKINISLLAKSISVTKEKINELILRGIFPKSLKEGYCVSSELFRCLNSWLSMPQFEISKENQLSLEDLRKAYLIEERGGIFVISSDVYPSNYEGMTDEIEKYGLWNAQGLNNHIHFRSITTNAIYQIILAGEIIEIWKKLICQLKTENQFVIYWNGLTDSTICIYMQKKIGSHFLEEFDTQLGMTSVYVNEIFCTEETPAQT